MYKHSEVASHMKSQSCDRWRAGTAPKSGRVTLSATLVTIRIRPGGPAGYMI